MRKESYKRLERRRCGQYLHLMGDVEGNSLLSKWESPTGKRKIWFGGAGFEAVTLKGVLCQQQSDAFQGLHNINTLRTGSFKLFKRPFLGFLTILTL